MNMLTVAMIVLLGTVTAQAETMRMAVTTSFQDSGHSDLLLPALLTDTGIAIDLLVVDSGQTLRLGAAGDVDAVLAHARDGEEALIAQGNATHRREIMYSNFVIIGPTDDPARIAQSETATEALRAIAAAQQASSARLTPEGAWYQSAGSGMGASLNTASAIGAFILSDRATWASFGNPGYLALLFEGDPALYNQYAYLPINATTHPHVKAELAARVEDWLTSPKAAQIKGTQMFTFNAQ